MEERPESGKPSLKVRLDGLRTLRGLTQDEFTAACAAHGLGKTEAARVERGALEFRGKHAMVFAAVLHVPSEWITDDDLDRLFWAADGGAPATRFAALAHEAGEPPDEPPESPQEEEDDEDEEDEAP